MRKVTTSVSATWEGCQLLTDEIVSKQTISQAKQRINDYIVKELMLDNEAITFYNIDVNIKVEDV